MPILSKIIMNDRKRLFQIMNFSLKLITNTNIQTRHCRRDWTESLQESVGKSWLEGQMWGSCFINNLGRSSLQTIRSKTKGRTPKSVLADMSNFEQRRRPDPVLCSSLSVGLSILIIRCLCLAQSQTLLYPSCTTASKNSLHESVVFWLLSFYRL